MMAETGLNSYNNYETLIGILRDENAKVDDRMGAVANLGAHEKVIPQLIQLINSTEASPPIKSPELRLKIIEVLSSLGKKTHNGQRHVLMMAISSRFNDQDDGVRMGAASAIGELADAECFGVIESGLIDSEDKVRICAVFAFKGALLRGVGSVDRLRSVLEIETSPNVRDAVFQSLVVINSDRLGAVEKRAEAAENKMSKIENLEKEFEALKDSIVKWEDNKEKEFAEWQNKKDKELADWERVQYERVEELRKNVDGLKENHGQIAAKEDIEKINAEIKLLNESFSATQKNMQTHRAGIESALASHRDEIDKEISKIQESPILKISSEKLDLISNTIEEAQGLRSEVGALEGDLKSLIDSADKIRESLKSVEEKIKATKIQTEVQNNTTSDLQPSPAVQAEGSQEKTASNEDSNDGSGARAEITLESPPANNDAQKLSTMKSIHDNSVHGKDKTNEKEKDKGREILEIVRDMQSGERQ